MNEGLSTVVIDRFSLEALRRLQKRLGNEKKKRVAEQIKQMLIDKCPYCKTYVDEIKELVCGAYDGYPSVEGKYSFRMIFHTSESMEHQYAHGPFKDFTYYELKDGKWHDVYNDRAEAKQDDIWKKGSAFCVFIQPAVIAAYQAIMIENGFR